MLKARKIVHTNLSPECWLLTSRNELRLTDLDWAQAEGRPQTEFHGERPFHRCTAPEILLGSRKLTSAADVWGFGCILFEMATGETFFTRLSDTPIALLANIGQFIGDAPDEIFTALRVLPAYSFLSRQTKRAPPRESPFAQRLPLEFRHLEPLFQAIFHWNPSERICLDAVSKHPFFGDVLPACELPILTLPEA
jgi:cell division cycle 2-like protein